MAQDIVVDTSIFSKMAELLARPLSPTALEKEELLAKNAKSTPTSVSSRGRKLQRAPGSARGSSGTPVKASSKAKANPAVSSIKASPTAAVTRSDEPIAALGQDLVEVAAGTEDSAEGPGHDCGILSAVAELSGLQQEWKDKMKSPSHRKAGPPRMKKPPEQKILSEEERQHKMEEIDSLEAKLAQAKGVAAAATAAAAAAQTAAAGLEQDEDTEDEENENAHKAKEDQGAADALQRQAEKRVRMKKRQEAKEQKERAQKEAEEKCAKQAAAEAKVKELEQVTKQRLQERLRAERAKERELREERERHTELREQSMHSVEELQQQALKRVAEREKTKRQRAEEVAKQESEAHRIHAEENEARAQELREKTRLRMQQHAREQREQMLVEQEAQLKQQQEESQANIERQTQAQINQQKAKARAAEFRQRMRLEEEARARLEEEHFATEQERSEAARLDRRQKRQWRPGDPVLPAPPVAPASSSTAKVAPPGPQASRMANQMPPRPPEPAGGNVRTAQAGAPGSAGAVAVLNGSDATRSKTQSRETSRGASAKGAPQIRRVNSRKFEVERNSTRGTASASQVVEGKNVENEQPETAWSPAVDDGETVRCNVGFFGVGSDPFDDDDNMEDSLNDDHSLQGPARVPDGHAKISRLPSRGSSRGSTRAPSAPAPPLQPSPAAMVARALSQPPLARNSNRPAAVIDSPTGEYSRGSSPRWDPVDDLGADRLAGGCGLPRSPGSGSSHSEPNAHGRYHLQPSPALNKPTPWKQKAIKVQSADYYLDAMKAARGRKQAKGDKVGQDKTDAAGYAAQVRQRASDVEVQQREQEDARMGKGYAALQRVQQRGLQASPMRSASAG
mmetsp:Transcript_89691/g.159348  ORF Transcript_89691/g.159348 Transcript_89691/m.159348 type:complete len:853 (-) Transcript_89691:78-2636(-)|eukprot:CAMPEP_0197644512 /NCGR_PEP_ID=MMETSP1338-20131121/17459_1 /TAXON_ID=43686 ORGANISM="Pelagodinium beii, Strain RCC1491" /NCGR_SAMPLE_ID=MMETSP1338 /ASSEMBLY_ACC=CAM_ASM_000754 /LENGTH=852 /DNA_ID=CAMNT_0043217919 /DNA_START=82 /DNA_END=2640 /DNA_ORIENTATION=+